MSKFVHIFYYRFPWNVLRLHPLRNCWARQDMGLDTILWSVHLCFGQGNQQVTLKNPLNTIPKQNRNKRNNKANKLKKTHFLLFKQTYGTRRRLWTIANCQRSLQIGHWQNQQIRSIPILLSEIRLRGRCKARISRNQNRTNTKWREERISEVTSRFCLPPTPLPPPTPPTPPTPLPPSKFSIS